MKGFDWIKLDVQTASNPKLLSVSPEARWLWLTLVCYSMQHCTDGVIVQGVANTLGAPQHFRELRNALLTHGVTIEKQRHIVINDYLDHNPSRDQITAIREKTALRVRKHRSRN